MLRPLSAWFILLLRITNAKSGRNKFELIVQFYLSVVWLLMAPLSDAANTSFWLVYIK